MHLRVLGSGTIAGRTGRNCAGFLIDDRLLLDCGPGVWSSLYSAAAAELQINHILLSHFHVDHTADLIPFLWRRWVLETERRNLLTIHGPAGLEQWFAKLTIVHGEWMKDLSISTHEFRDTQLKETLRIDANGTVYLLQALPTKHSAHSVCLKLSAAGERSLFYSGDSGWNENLLTLAEACDLALLDCAYPSPKAEEDHLTPELAGKIAAAADIKRLMLIHLYPETWDPDPVQKAARHFSGEILAARDGLVVRV